jgi:WD40 repeat protein
MLAGSDGGLVLYRLAPPELELLGVWSTGRQKISAAAVSADGHYFAVKGPKNSLRLWDLTGTQHSSYLRVGEADYSKSPGWCKMVVSSATRHIALATWGKQIEIRDCRTGEKLAAIAQPYVRELQWTHDGQKLLTVTPPDPSAPVLGGFTHLHVTSLSDLNPSDPTAQPSQSGSTEIDLGMPVLCLKSSPKDGSCAVSSTKNGVTIFSADKSGYRRQCDLEPKQQTVVNLTFNQRGNLLACSDLDGVIWLWNTKDWQLAAKLQLSDRGGCFLQFSPDDRMLAAACPAVR